jgi:methyl-accepting chemotaxis protein/aerotaxis receptor
MFSKPPLAGEGESNIIVQRGTGETRSASAQVFAASQALSRDSNRLKLGVGSFFNIVRAT